MGQHREAGALLFARVRAAALLMVHHQQVVEVHFGVYCLCSEQDEDRGAERKQERKQKKGQKKLSQPDPTTVSNYSSINRITVL